MFINLLLYYVFMIAKRDSHMMISYSIDNGVKAHCSVLSAPFYLIYDLLGGGVSRVLGDLDDTENQKRIVDRRLRRKRLCI